MFFFRLFFNYTDADGMMHFDAIAFYKGTHHIHKRYFNLIYNQAEKRFENLSDLKLEDFESALIFQAELESELLLIETAAAK